MKKTFFDSSLEAINFVCNSIKDKLIEDLNNLGSASLILTGGKTVRPFLSQIAKIDIPWNKVWVILSDERWVPTDDEQSNEKQLKDLFLSKLAEKPKYISLKTDDDPEEAIVKIESRLSVIPKPFSFCLLSMGSDGHIASLFANGENNDCNIVKVFKNGLYRIGLGLEEFKKCNNIFILVNKDREPILSQINMDILDHPLTKLTISNAVLL